jgi:hypothetical protein
VSAIPECYALNPDMQPKLLLTRPLARLLSPNVSVFVLSGLLRDKNTAATWTLAGTAFQRSFWPFILRADSFYTHGVPKKIFFLSTLMSLMAGLIALAGVVTPLGLYETVEPSHNTQAPFIYTPDSSFFGLGTPPRSNYSFTRLCVVDIVNFPLPCPFTDTVVVITYDANGTINYNYPYDYDLNVPEKLIDTFSSGTSNNTTVSNFFDIQWRQYLTTNSINQQGNVGYNNGSTYLVGTFRNMESLILNKAYQPVEGLVVDTINGGIGFRNHTVPPGFQYGVTWDEDLLFIEPETVCVDTNLTIDFTVANSPNYSIIIDNLVLTDRGGFANLNHTFPDPNLSNPQSNPDLYGRAYKAAWLNNVNTMLYYNVTTDNNETTGEKAFAYLNSFVGRTYQLQAPGLLAAYNTLTITTTFGDYLNFGGSSNDFLSGVSSGQSDSGPPTNPFGVNSTNFESISMLFLTHPLRHCPNNVL